MAKGKLTAAQLAAIQERSRMAMNKANKKLASDWAIKAAKTQIQQRASRRNAGSN